MRLLVGLESLTYIHHSMTHDKAPYILALDIGSSSTRAILFDNKAQVVPGGVAQRSIEMQTAANGTGVYDIGQVLENVVHVIDHLLVHVGPLADQIGAVAMDTLVSNILGVDADGTPVTPVYTYADTRNAPDADTLRTELGSAGMAQSHDRTGCVIHTSYLPTRFRWLARQHPDLLAKSRRWISIGEYLHEQFTGTRAVSYSVASWTGLLNRRALAWDKAWLDQLPLAEAQLSPLVDFGDAARGLQGAWRERWPALKDVPWFPAIGDGAAANIGSGCDAAIRVDKGIGQRVALTMGTTGAMRVVLNPAQTSAIATVPDGLWLYRVDGRRGLLGGATTEGGNVYAWLTRTLQLPAADDIENVLCERPPAAHGLTILPFVAGERAPGWNDDARASMVGFSLSTRPLDIVQAALEGIAYRFALIYQQIAPNLATEPPPQIIASGGALLSSPAWLQIMADVLGQPVLALAETEITSRGLALLALENLGVITDTSALPPTLGKLYEPDLTHHASHQDALARQVAIYDRLAE